MPEYDPVAKISIIPRGQAGGLTFSLQVKRGSSLDCTAEATWRIRWLLPLEEGIHHSNFILDMTLIFDYQARLLDSLLYMITFTSSVLIIPYSNRTFEVASSVLKPIESENIYFSKLL